MTCTGSPTGRSPPRTGRTTSATRMDVDAGPAGRRGAGRDAGRAARRRRADGRAVPVARPHARAPAPAATRCITCWRTRSPAPELSDDFLHRARGVAVVRLGAAVRAGARGLLRPGRGDRWAAQRVRAEFAEFAAEAALAGDAPLLFTGEMIYPWAFEQDPALRPLAEAAEPAGRARRLARAVRRRSASAGTRSRRPPPSTSTTCTCRGSCRCRPPTPSAACGLGHQRVRARRAAGQRRRRARPADQLHVARPTGRGLTRHAGGRAGRRLAARLCR